MLRTTTPILYEARNLTEGELVTSCLSPNWQIPAFEYLRNICPEPLYIYFLIRFFLIVDLQSNIFFIELLLRILFPRCL
jgi:hypothetical protein